MLQQMARHMDNSYCSFAQGAAAPVLGLLRYFEDEVREHISQRQCPCPSPGKDLLGFVVNLFVEASFSSQGF